MVRLQLLIDQRVEDLGTCQEDATAAVHAEDGCPGESFAVARHAALVRRGRGMWLLRARHEPMTYVARRRFTAPSGWESRSHSTVAGVTAPDVLSSNFHPKKMRKLEAYRK